MTPSSLPWFIRREIIDIVTLDNPQYISVSKEWLKQFVKRSGSLNIRREISKETDSIQSSLLMPNFNSIVFKRITNIDWDSINTCKYVKSATVIIDTENLFEYEIFVTNLLQLPPLTDLIFDFRVSTLFELTDILNCNQNSLKYLSFAGNLKNWYPILTEVAFPKLVTLSIFGNGEKFIIQDAVNKHVSLRELSLHYSMPGFNELTMPHITELELSHDDNKFNLVLFPNLKKITLYSSTKFHCDQPSEIVEELIIYNYIEDYHLLISQIFPKLKILELTVSYGDNEYDPIVFLPYYIYLTKLTIFTYNWYEFSETLPDGPFLVSTLILVGSFLITNRLLRWLSTNLKLERLDLNNCYTSKEVPLKFVPFDHLNMLSITSHANYIRQFETVFNYDNYPQIKMLVITEDNNWEHERIPKKSLSRIGH